MVAIGLITKGLGVNSRGVEHLIPAFFNLSLPIRIDTGGGSGKSISYSKPQLVNNKLPTYSPSHDDISIKSTTYSISINLNGTIATDQHISHSNDAKISLQLLYPPSVVPELQNTSINIKDMKIGDDITIYITNLSIG